MRTIISQINRFWSLDGVRLRVGTPYELGDGWSFFIQKVGAQRGSGHRTDLAMVHVSKQAFGFTIDQESHILMTEHGAASLTEPTEYNIDLAAKLLETLAMRGITLFIKLTRLPAEERLHGLQFKSSQNATANNFTDGKLIEISHKKRQCTGGTFLVRAQRHNGQRIFRLDIIVEDGFNLEKLLETLHTIS